jgi:hypothetical protein
MAVLYSIGSGDDDFWKRLEKMSNRPIYKAMRYGILSELTNELTPVPAATIAANISPDVPPMLSLVLSAFGRNKNGPFQSVVQQYANVAMGDQDISKLFPQAFAVPFEAWRDTEGYRTKSGKRISDGKGGRESLGVADAVVRGAGFNTVDRAFFKDTFRDFNQWNKRLQARRQDVADAYNKERSKSTKEDIREFNKSLRALKKDYGDLIKTNEIDDDYLEARKSDAKIPFGNSYLRKK